MLIKAGVDISRLKREIRRALSVVATLYLNAHTELVITSTYEGLHSSGSLHYANLAFDIRYPPAARHFNRQLIAEHLGDSFDVCFESDHIHIEFDPW